MVISPFDRSNRLKLSKKITLKEEMEQRGLVHIYRDCFLSPQCQIHNLFQNSRVSFQKRLHDGTQNKYPLVGRIIIILFSQTIIN